MINPKIFRQVRKALGLTQQQLADELGLSRVTINKMEKGRLKNGIPDDVGARLLALRPAPKRSNPFEDAARGRDVNNDNHLWDNEDDSD